MPGTTPAQIFVTNYDAGTIGEYTTSGVPVNPAPITGLNGPVGIAVSGEDLFVTNLFGSTVGKYTTSGVPVDPALITGNCSGSPRGVWREFVCREWQLDE
jgi:hypothetical protein